MDYPIAQVKTKDEVCLYGLFLEAPEKRTVFINIHGTGSNFYEEDFIEFFTQSFLKNGISLLSTNNRGAGVYDAYQKSGAAIEKFEDCVIDIDAWVSFVLDRGYEKIILSGHSLGTEKVVYYMNNGKYASNVSAVVLLAPADSFGSHRLHEGKLNPRAVEVEELLRKSEELIKSGNGGDFLPKNAYGSHEGIMPKSAESFVNFLGKDSELLKALPFVTKRLEAYSKIAVPILVVIGDESEYTGLTVEDTLDLMRSENKNTVAVQLKDCDHDFQGKAKELTQIIVDFLTL